MDDKDYKELMKAFLEHKQDFVEHKAEVKVLSKEVSGISITMKDVSSALAKIASLEEHRSEAKKDFDDLFKRTREAEQKVAVLQSEMKDNKSTLSQIMLWIVCAALVSMQIFGD